jgi:hypothetical protein
LIQWNVGEFHHGFIVQRIENLLFRPWAEPASLVIVLVPITLSLVIIIPVTSSSLVVFVIIIPFPISSSLVVFVIVIPVTSLFDSLVVLGAGICGCL